MKTKVFFAISLSVLIACGGNKQARLEALKKQHDMISQKIEKLEKENAQLKAEISDIKTLKAEVEELKTMMKAGKLLGRK